MKFKIIEERDTPTPVPVSRYTSDTASASSTTPPPYTVTEYRDAARRREFGETPVRTARTLIYAYRTPLPAVWYVRLYTDLGVPRTMRKSGLRRPPVSCTIVK